MSSDTLPDIDYWIKQYHKTRSKSMEICDPLETEDYVVQPIQDVSPPKWHLAHTTWFFETFLLVPYSEDYQLFHKEYPYLFNSYYVAAGDRWVRAHRGNLTRPTVKEIMSYREYVDDHVQRLLPCLRSSWDDSLEHILMIGINHEQQHQELLLYDIKYILGNNPLLPAYRTANNTLNVSDDQHEEDWIQIPAGQYQIGWQGEGFSFDNEHGVHTVYLSEVGVSNRLVTNKEYLQFIDAGGYEDAALWLSEGWDWVKSLEYKVPEYWHKVKGVYHQYTFEGLQQLIPDQPVMHVSFYEADAYARWKGLRLPTEREWEIACRLSGEAIPENANFLDSGVLQPLGGKGHFFGNLWEWTSSSYRPYPGYQAPSGALGEYNGKFMINQMVLRGGSFATERNHIRYSYRNFFHPHLRWMFSGTRSCEIEHYASHQIC